MPSAIADQWQAAFNSLAADMQKTSLIKTTQVPILVDHPSQIFVLLKKVLDMYAIPGYTKMRQGAICNGALKGLRCASSIYDITRQGLSKRKIDVQTVQAKTSH